MVELAQQRGDVTLDRPDRDAQLVGDVGVGEVLAHQGQHFGLAFGDAGIVQWLRPGHRHARPSYPIGGRSVVRAGESALPQDDRGIRVEHEGAMPLIIADDNRRNDSGAGAQSESDPSTWSGRAGGGCGARLPTDLASGTTRLGVPDLVVDLLPGDLQGCAGVTERVHDVLLWPDRRLRIPRHSR
jgi:hypothetical protein